MQSDWPPEGAAPDELVRADSDAAPPEAVPNGEAAAPSPEPPRAETVDPGPSLAAAAVPPPPAAPVWRDLPVASVLPPVAPLLAPSAADPFEDRIRRLEAELVRLRNLPAPPHVAAPPAPEHQVQTQPPGRFWNDLGKRLIAPSGPVAAPPPPPAGLASMVPAGVRRTWLILDALTELRAIYWMFFDPRYRLSWLARLAPLVIGALILTSSFWMPGAAIPFVGPVIDKVADLILAYGLYKYLSYEARRYRETAPDLPPGLRQ